MAERSPNHQKTHGQSLGHRRERRIATSCLIVTLLSALLALYDVNRITAEKIQEGAWSNAFELILFSVIILSLVYGAVVYQLTRLGAERRHRTHTPAAQCDLERIHSAGAPSLSVLIPSYKEEPSVVLLTMLSAALMEYPKKRVVLLIDDPPHPQSVSDRILLTSARALPLRAARVLRPPLLHCESAMQAFLARPANQTDHTEEVHRLICLYRYCAHYLEGLEAGLVTDDHAGKFFGAHILRRPALQHRRRADELARTLLEPMPVSSERILLEYRRLTSFFDAKFEAFERKRFSNLSHASNKAMNINSFLSLMGRRLHVDERPDGGAVIRDSEDEQGSFRIPQSDYVLTLDADSLLLPDYALRLIHFMEQPQNGRVAIAQTPYSAYPGAPTPIDRTAGITTDIQHIVHQGSTYFGATYWVGANALIRRKALDDIAVVSNEDGKDVVKFIQDRTVIEDTESSVDLLLKGWTLHNYPARLAFSATPPDYGALLIQRRRWANGGLIILRKLLEYIAHGPVSKAKFLQAFVQIHYLTSPTIGSFGVLALIFYPFEDGMRSFWLPLAALPYLYLYGRDMTRIGYEWKDLPRVYALNLLLLPINLGGVCKSISQLVTGRRTPFARTPKVSSRTAAPPLYIGFTLGLLGYCALMSAIDLLAGRWAHAGFGFLSGLAFAYAFGTFVGLRAGLADLLQRDDGAPRTVVQQLSGPVPGVRSQAESASFSMDRAPKRRHAA